MKKTININLGGYPFTINEDVYHDLHKYLNTIRRHFSKSEGVDEIMADIELRMAELFTESKAERHIIEHKDLDEVVSIMGTPEQFGADYIYEEDETEYESHTAYREIQTGRRFFRDTDHKVIGGVCSGISAYWGIEDPIWMRIVFGLLLLSGIGLFPYIILWIIVPSAKTAGDRLAMRGESANVENIGRMIEDEIHEMSDRIHEIKNDFFSKKKNETMRFSALKRINRLVLFLLKVVIGVITSALNVTLQIFGYRKTRA